MQEIEALKILQRHQIPYSKSGVKGVAALLRKSEVDQQKLRKLGFRISNMIGDQLVVFYKGGRFGLIL